MIYEQSYYNCVVIYDNRGIIREDEIREISFNNLKYNTFELIEDETIDIDNIEELDTYETVETYDWQDVDTNRMTINELV